MSRLRIIAPLAFVLTLAGLLGCKEATPAEPPAEGTPRLVLLVVSDQFRHDSLERGRPLFTGGLARLLDEGVSFDAAHHGHAVTSTGPGHASIASGVHPAGSGVVGNGWFQRPEPDWAYVVDDPKFGTSPANLAVSTLGDWIKERYPRSKVFAVSGKDLSAVLTGGHRADGVFWFDEDEGGFTTSGFYAEAPPAWLDAVNRAGLPETAFLEGWKPLPVDPEAAAAAGFWPFDRGPFDDGFPRLVGGDASTADEDFLDGLYRTPYLDQWVAGLGLGLVRTQELGADECL